jgi:hypothetical protein
MILVTSVLGRTLHLFLNFVFFNSNYISVWAYFLYLSIKQLRIQVQGVLVLRELGIRCFAFIRFYSKEVFLHRLQYYKMACARWVTDLLFAF